MNKYRTAQVLINDKWIDIEFKNIKEGDKFRLFEPDGTIVKDNDGNTEFIATSNPYLAVADNNEEVYQIDTL